MSALSLSKGKCVDRQGVEWQGQKVDYTTVHAATVQDAYFHDADVIGNPHSG